MRAGKIFPISLPYSVVSHTLAREGCAVKSTGERRRPRKGEWYLSGAIIEGYLAPADLDAEFDIAVLVRVRKIVIYEEVK